MFNKEKYELNHSNDNEKNISKCYENNGYHDNISLISKQYKISYCYNDEINKTYVHLNIFESVGELEINGIIDEIICKVIKKYEHEIKNDSENDVSGEKQTTQCGSEIDVYEYEYVKMDLMKLINACRNECDDSFSLRLENDERDYRDDELDDELDDGDDRDDELDDDRDDDRDDELDKHEDKCIHAVAVNTVTESNNKIENITFNITEIKEDDGGKPKLNFNKIKNIVQKNEKEKISLKNPVSIHKKINNIVKKITNKFKLEFTKDVINYGNILETYSLKKKNKNVDIDNMLHAFYHLILDKFSSKVG